MSIAGVVFHSDFFFISYFIPKRMYEFLPAIRFQCFTPLAHTRTHTLTSNSTIHLSSIKFSIFSPKTLCKSGLSTCLSIGWACIFPILPFSVCTPTFISHCYYFDVWRKVFVFECKVFRNIFETCIRSGLRMRMLPWLQSISRYQMIKQQQITYTWYRKHSISMLIGWDEINLYTEIETVHGVNNFRAHYITSFLYEFTLDLKAISL